MADNNDAFQALLRQQQQGNGSTNPHLTGGTGAISVVAGIAPTDTQIGGGHFQDQQGVHGATVYGLGSMFTSKKGPGPVAKALADTQRSLSEMSAAVNEQIKQAAAGLTGGLVIGGSGAGGIDGPMPTPAPANDSKSTGRSA